MECKGRLTDFKKLLIQRLALAIAVVYLLSPLQHHIGDVLHSLSHDLSLPDYVMTHARGSSKEFINAHQYADHRTGEIVHEHEILDFVQSLLQDGVDNEQSPDPNLPSTSIDKHLVLYGYKLAYVCNFENLDIPVVRRQNTCNGHSQLWQEPPISVLL